MKIEVNGLGELPKAASEIINYLDKYKIVAFFGQMGAGKTTLIKEICKQLGVKDIVTSPTFALVNHYVTANSKNVYHFDFYRIERIEEAYDLGYEEYFYSGDICMIEWSEKVSELLPDDVLSITITPTDENKREITII